MQGYVMRIDKAIISSRAPNRFDLEFLDGQFWLDTTAGELWIKAETYAGRAIWFNAKKQYFQAGGSSEAKKVDPTPIVSAKYALQELQRCIEKMEDIIKG